LLAEIPFTDQAEKAPCHRELLEWVHQTRSPEPRFADGEEPTITP
jgi:hypothetical protein